MYWLAALAGLELFMETLLCNGGYGQHSKLRRWHASVTLVLLVAVSLALAIWQWHIWLWGLPVAGYRCINVLRVQRARLPEQYLRTACARSFWWLLALQAAVVGLAALTYYSMGLEQLLDGLLAVQLLAAIIL